MAFAGGGDQLLVWDDKVNVLRVFDTQSWAQVATISMPWAPYSSSNGRNWGDLSVGDNGAFVYVGGQMASIDLAAMGLTELTASAPSAGLVEAGVNPDGSATAGVSTSTVNLTPRGGTAALTYATAGWTSQGSGLYSRAGIYGSAVLDTVHNTLSYTLDNAAAATLALGIGVTATESFTVEVGDGTSNATDLVSFSVTGTDVDPTVIGHSQTAVNTVPSIESSAALLAGAADVKGQPLHVVSVRNATHGVVSLDAQGDAVFTPNAGYVGPASYDYSVGDGKGGAATATVQVNVLAPASLAASAPSAALVEAGVTPSGVATPGVATSTVGLTPSGGDSPTYVLTGWTPLGSGRFSRTGTYGSVVLDTTHNTLTYTLDNSVPATLRLGVGVTASDAFTVQIADEFTTASASVSFSVTGTDVDPTVIGHTFSTDEQKPLVESGAALLAGSQDLKGASLHVSSVGDATHGSVVLDGHGNAVFTPDAGYVGLASYAYTVSDGLGGTATATVQVNVVPPADTLDFNGEGMSDVLWRNTTTGEVGAWEPSPGGGSVNWVPFGSGGAGWTIAGVGDFSGDGKPDILWQDASAGQTQVGAWESSPGGGFSWVPFGTGGAGWTIAGVGDFSGDGRPDILWQDTVGGRTQVGAWETSPGGGSTWVSFGSGGSGWTIASVGDFNADGMSDILWQDTVAGQVQVGAWETSPGGGSSWVSFGTGGSGWTVAGVGDFNGDGKADILWQDTVAGQVQVGAWESSAGSGLSWVSFGTGGPGWAIAGVGDYNGDGRSDVLWRNSSTGQMGAWESSPGGGSTSWVNFGTMSSQWQAQT